MGQIVYLVSKKAPARARAQAPNAPAESVRLADKRRLAHDLKNCMSVLLLGLATLDGDGDQWTLSARSRDMFEGAVFEMNGIVEELIDEDTNSRRPGYTELGLPDKPETIEARKL